MDDEKATRGIPDLDKRQRSPSIENRDDGGSRGAKQAPRIHAGESRAEGRPGPGTSGKFPRVSRVFVLFRCRVRTSTYYLVLEITKYLQIITHRLKNEGPLGHSVGGLPRVAMAAHVEPMARFYPRWRSCELRLLTFLGLDLPRCLAPFSCTRASTEVVSCLEALTGAS